MTSNKTTIVGLPLATLQAAGAPLKKEKIGFRCSEKEPDSRDRRKKLKRALKKEIRGFLLFECTLKDSLIATNSSVSS